MLSIVVSNITVLAIAMIYYTWRDFVETRARRQRQRQERVAHMLWAMAQRAE